MNAPFDPNERRFFLARGEARADGEMSGPIPTNPLTGGNSNGADPRNLMTWDEAHKWADWWNERRVHPVLGYAVAYSPVDPYKILVDRTDTGNANLLIGLSGGNLRYVPELRQWLWWSGSRWQMDEHEVFVTTRAMEVARYYLEAAQGMKKGTYQLTTNGDVEMAEDIYKWGVKCRSKSTLDAMVTLARKFEGVPISITQLDRNPWLLGVHNGVVDLKTGELRENEAREDYITKRCAVRYNPAAVATRWQQFIDEIMGEPIAAETDDKGEVIASTVGRFKPRPALARYLQKALGYSLTGETREQKLFLAIGPGSNGKNVVFDAVKRVMGKYSAVLPSEALMATSRPADAERPTALAASLAGARFALSSETRAGQRLDVNLVKNHTGDAEMTARRMRENPTTFRISHKLWLMTNNRPALDHVDPATRGRLHLIPFDRRWNRPGEFERDPMLPDGDKELAAQLEREDEGILAWLVQGAMLYFEEGLEPPPEVMALTRDYILEQDVLGQWLTTWERCPPKQGTLAAELFRQFVTRCAADGRPADPSTPTAFGLALRGRGVESKDVERGKLYGLRQRAGGDLDPKTVFGSAQYQLPPGATPVPQP